MHYIPNNTNKLGTVSRIYDANRKIIQQQYLSNVQTNVRSALTYSRKRLTTTRRYTLQIFPICLLTNYSGFESIACFNLAKEAKQLLRQALFSSRFFMGTFSHNC